MDRNHPGRRGNRGAGRFRGRGWGPGSNAAQQNAPTLPPVQPFLNSENFPSLPQQSPHPPIRPTVQSGLNLDHFPSLPQQSPHPPIRPTVQSGLNLDHFPSLPQQSPHPAQSRTSHGQSAPNRPPARTWSSSLFEARESSTESQRSCVPSTSVPPVNEPQSSTQSTEQLQSIKRPDRGGVTSFRKVQIFANYFEVKFNVNTIIIHYDVDIQLASGNVSKKISKINRLSIKEKLFSDNPSVFPPSRTTFDGEKNIFSAVTLKAGKFIVEVPDGQDRTKPYQVTLKEVNQLPLGRLKDYIDGRIQSIPRDVIQSMELALRENPSNFRIPVGRSFFPKSFTEQNDLGEGIVALQGFQSSLKHTEQGAALCLDYTVLAFQKPVDVIPFLGERINRFNITAFSRFRDSVEKALKGVKVRVTHRYSRQKYKIQSLTTETTRNLFFNIEDPEKIAPARRVGLVQYFREKYNKEIIHQDIPCLDVGRIGRSNYVPMEFCIIAEGERVPKDLIEQKKDINKRLKEMSLVKPAFRMQKICEMVQAEDGPCGGTVIQNFGMEVMTDMKKIQGRVLNPPSVKLGLMSGNKRLKAPNVINVDYEKCSWNLNGKSVVEGIPVTSWAVLDFTATENHRVSLKSDIFVESLITRCGKLEINMAAPLHYERSRMSVLDNQEDLDRIIRSIITNNCNGKLQILLCAMTMEHSGYKTLKYLTETKIGVVTQCFLSTQANKVNDQYITNLALKINAKLGGCNMQLTNGIPSFNGQGHVMFIGADVNHPGGKEDTIPSIAAVVASMNWPTANRYASRVSPQSHRKECIENFGVMCVSLIQTYETINRVRPQRIIVFRDGVSEGQFGMVLNTELIDLKNSIKRMEGNNYYRPTITVVVAQKRHSTRLFADDKKKGIVNVVSGTVVDRDITHPFEFDFFLASHQGIIGTSKPTHYYVLYDEHGFTSDKIQILIYHLCFTFARCTKPVSLVPPVYYADLMAYRGRLYQEAIKQINEPASDSSYTLHSDLENMMYFV